MKSQNIQTAIYYSPCGDLLLGALTDKLCLCDWMNRRNHDSIIKRLERILKSYVESPTPTDASNLHPILRQATNELDEYFAGERKQFDVPLLTVGTAFQQEVWSELLKVPYGQTISYAEEAARMGRPNAIRAVANANGGNAISIFIPCHRIIGINGKLTGYAGGLKAKQALLALEQKVEIRTT